MKRITRKYRVVGRPYVFAVSRRKRASSIRINRAVSNRVDNLSTSTI
jgi:hypothetical protein